MAEQPDASRAARADRRRRARATSRASSTPTRARWPAGQRPAERRLVPGHHRGPPGLHPLRPLHPRLRRHPAQRRHRPHRQGLRQRGSRFDLDTPMGDVDLRRVRRVRGGLPDERPDQQGDHGPSRTAQLHLEEVDSRLPLLRRRLRAHLPRGRGGEQGRVRRGSRAERQRRPPVREGPLRLRLRHPPPPPDEAADPQGGVLPEAAPLRRTCRASDGVRAARRASTRDYDEDARRLPRGDLGRGARPRRLEAARPSATRTARTRWRASAAPSARTKRPTSSRRWCAPRSARTTSTTARGSATPRASRRCSRRSAPAP